MVDKTNSGLESKDGENEGAPPTQKRNHRDSPIEIMDDEENIGKVINGGNFGTDLGNLGTNIRGLGTKLADRIGTDVNAQTIGNIDIGNSDNVDKTETEILQKTILQKINLYIFP